MVDKLTALREEGVAAAALLREQLVVSCLILLLPWLLELGMEGCPALSALPISWHCGAQFRLVDRGGNVLLLELRLVKASEFAHELVRYLRLDSFVVALGLLAD